MRKCRRVVVSIWYEHPYKVIHGRSALKFSSLLYSSLFVGVAGCLGPTTVKSTGVLGVTVTPSSATIKPGHMLQFTASVSASPGLDTTVTWQSTNTAAVTVDSTGLATAVTVGSAIIVAISKADKTQEGAAQVTVATSITTLRANP
jgi:hypothetical protein